MKPGKPRPPAYGKLLLEARRAGVRIVDVAVVVGYDWAPPSGGRPRLALKPEDYAPGTVDWRCVAGLAVAVHLSDGRYLETVKPLLAEVARLAPEVDIVTPWPLVREFGCRCPASVLAWCDRAPDEQGRLQWPSWWPGELERDHERRKQQFRSWVHKRAA